MSETKRLTGLEIDDIAALTTLSSARLQLQLGRSLRESHPAFLAAGHRRQGRSRRGDHAHRRARPDPLDALPAPRADVLKPVLTLAQKRVSLARRALASRGWWRRSPGRFIGKEEAKHFGGGTPELALANPIAAELSDMRPSLLPGLLRAARRNADTGRGISRSFEVGQVFAFDEPAGQTMRASGVRRGLAGDAGVGRHWSGRARRCLRRQGRRLRASRGARHSAGRRADRPGRPALVPSRPLGEAAVRPEDRWSAAFGELHPRTLELLDVKGPVVGFEITLDLLPAPKSRATRAKPKLALSELQPVRRDFAFVVEKSVAAGDIVKTVQNSDQTLIADVDRFRRL